MSLIAQNRINFIEQLHERFLMKKGHGAFAFISLTDAVSLFDAYLDSGKTADLYINQYVSSI